MKIGADGGTGHEPSPPPYELRGFLDLPAPYLGDTGSELNYGLFLMERSRSVEVCLCSHRHLPSPPRPDYEVLGHRTVNPRSVAS